MTSLQTSRFWLPEGAPAWRAATVVLLPALVAGALFAILDMPAEWGEPVLLATLVAISAVTFAGQVNYDSAERGGVRFDASYAVVLVALVALGPLPALVVWATPELVGRFFLRGVPVISPGSIATVASFALGSLAGQGVLALAGNGVLAVAGAGVALWLVNFAVAAPLFSLGCEGAAAARALAREMFRPMAPVALGAVVIGAVTSLVMAQVGAWAAALLAIPVLTPELTLGWMWRARTVRELEAAQASALYAEALADILELDRGQRRVVAMAAGIPVPERSGDSAHSLGEELAAWVDAFGRATAGGGPERLEAHLIAMRVPDRFDGTDWPHGLGALELPSLPSRIVACAHAWSELTVRGGPELSHSEALLELRDRAGTQLDPKVVNAVGQVIKRESLLLGTHDFQPQLHRIPLPRRLRDAGVGLFAARA